MEILCFLADQPRGDKPADYAAVNGQSAFPDIEKSDSQVYRRNH